LVPKALLLGLDRHAGRVTVTVLAITTLAIGAFSAFVLPPDGTWSGDTGIRVLQVKLLREQGSFATPYLGQSLDPENQWNPFSPRYFSWQADGYYPKFSPAYAVLAASSEALGGRRAAAWPAALSLAVAAGALWWALRAVGSRASWAAAPMLVLLSPLLFYANELWEHETAVALATVGAAGLLVACLHWTGGRRRRAIALAALAGAALGFGLWFRAELYAFLPAIAIAALVVFRRAWLLLVAALLGCVALAAPLAWVQHLLYGRAEGAQVAVDSPLVLRGAGPSVVVVRMLRQWVDTVPGLLVPQGPRLLWAVAAAAVGLGAVSAARRTPWGHWVVIAGSGAVGLLALSNLAFRLAPVDLVASFPFILVGLFALGLPPVGARGVAFRFFGLTALLTLVFSVLTAPSPGGAQHGPRYLLLAYPLLAGCAILALERWVEQPASRRRTAGLAAAAVLIVASAAVQVAGLRNLVVIREQYARLARAMAALPPEPLVTDLWWFPQVIPDELLRRPVFLASEPVAVAKLADRLGESGVGVFTVVTSTEQSAPLRPATETAAGRRLRQEETVMVPERGIVIARYRIE
jgi:hypothetical protein